MKKRLLFQAYGMEEIIAECKYALLRLAAAYQTAENSLPEVVVYTNQPGEFFRFSALLTMHLVEVDTDQITAWKGTNNFVHRVKIEIIRDALQRFAGKLVYADTDTYCLQSLEQLFASIGTAQVAMHEKEGRLSQPQNLHFKKWKRFLQKTSVQIGIQPAIDTIMWNAGVIGLQQDHLPLLEKVLEITDKIYPLFPKHTVEQFAFGYTFQNAGLQIISAQPYLFHYWNLKEFRKVLRHFFVANEGLTLHQQMEAAQKLEPAAILERKLLFEHQPSIIRAFKKWMGKAWIIEEYVPKA